MGGTLTAVYDLARCPPTYDVVAFLALVEAERLGRSKDDVDLHILPGPVQGFRGDSLWPRYIDDRRRLVADVLEPICYLLPSLRALTAHNDRPRDLAGCFGHGQYLISLPNIVKALKAGSRPLRSPLPRERDPKLITITLREAEHWPLRNSNFLGWVIAAERLQARGYRVVVIRDTRMASEEIRGVTTSPEAALYMFRRAELYSRALVNMGISNGPMWLSIMMDAPTLMLRPTTNGAGGCFTDEFFAQYGVPKGSQLPTSPPYQYLVWEHDTPEAILRSFDEMLPCLTPSG